MEFRDRRLKSGWEDARGVQLSLAPGRRRSAPRNRLDTDRGPDDQRSRAPHTTQRCAARSSSPTQGRVTGGNPQVGCVLLDATGAIVAEGWHRGAGTPHAEVDALEQAAPSRRTRRRRPHRRRHPRALQPHRPHRPVQRRAARGRRRARRVRDQRPGPRVRRRRAATARRRRRGDRRGARRRGRGVPAPWLTAVRRGRPWVTVKWASTLDGRAAAADGTSQWITGTAARQRVHEQRAASDAILIGTGTVLADDPSLTARGDAGELLRAPADPGRGRRARRSRPTRALRRHPAGLIETGTRDLAAVLADLDEPRHPPGVRRGRPDARQRADRRRPRRRVRRLPRARPCWAATGSRSATSASRRSPSARRLRLDTVEQLGDDILITARPERELRCSPASSKSAARSLAWDRSGDAARITVRGPARGLRREARRLDLGRRRLPHRRRSGRRLVHRGCHGRHDRDEHARRRRGRRPRQPRARRRTSATGSAATSCRATSTAPATVLSVDARRRLARAAVQPRPASTRPLVARKGSIAVDGVTPHRERGRRRLVRGVADPRDPHRHHPRRADAGRPRQHRDRHPGPARRCA